MSNTTDLPPQTSFKLSMLINDTRYRSLTFQFIALLGLCFFIAWLISNAVVNLENLGQDISYRFLGNPAGYDINQQPISFSSQDTHLRAAFVGVLNTLIVAFLGCITATILGVFAGVLRLSNNWVVSKLMAVYVEAFRNVPVLIWILIIFSIMTVSLPGPRSFRGDNATATMLFDAFAFTNRGVYVPAPVWGSGSLIVVLTFVLSVIAMIAYRRYATKVLYDTGRLLPTLWPSIAIFFLPTILMFFIMGRPIGLDYPELRG
ncbi:MAG: ABC transporter permease subunit, partial [Dinoroseobacter sp.]|nr:ABC transporter permease subunit [Dinoroseobacter sp.]